PAAPRGGPRPGRARGRPSPRGGRAGREAGGDYRGLRVVEGSRVADLGARQRRTGMGSRLLDVPRRVIDQVDLVAAGGQPARVDAGASPDVEDAGGRRRQVALEDVLRARELEDPRPLEQATGLEAGLVEPSDVVGVAHG